MSKIRFHQSINHALQAGVETSTPGDFGVESWENVQDGENEDSQQDSRQALQS